SWSIGFDRRAAGPEGTCPGRNPRKRCFPYSFSSEWFCPAAPGGIGDYSVSLKLFVKTAITHLGDTFEDYGTADRAGLGIRKWKSELWTCPITRKCPNAYRP